MNYYCETVFLLGFYDMYLWLIGSFVGSLLVRGVTHQKLKIEKKNFAEEIEFIDRFSMKFAKYIIDVIKFITLCDRLYVSEYYIEILKS